MGIVRRHHEGIQTFASHESTDRLQSSGAALEEVMEMSREASGTWNKWSGDSCSSHRPRRRAVPWDGRL